MAAKTGGEPDAHRIRDGGPVVLFDGDCAFCHGAVAFIRARDRRGQLRFVPLRSPAARPYLGDVAGEGSPDRRGGAGVGGNPLRIEFDTLYFYENGRLYDRSTAALRIARHLKGLWPLASLLTVLPRALRDAVYTFIARRRHRIRL